MSSANERAFETALKVLYPQMMGKMEREYKFHPTRKYRFDFCWPYLNIGIECDGNAYHVKGGGRHGQCADYEKLNSALLHGWRVLRFTES